MSGVSRFYNDVIDDVVAACKDELADEGVDAQLLNQLKTLWRSKLDEAHVFDAEPSPVMAAQYVSLLQKTQNQLRAPRAAVPRVTTGIQGRQIAANTQSFQAPIGGGISAIDTSGSVGTPSGSFSGLRVPIIRAATASNAPNMTGVNVAGISTTSGVLNAVRLASHQPGNTMAAQGQAGLQIASTFPARGIVAAPGSVPGAQIATLPSGISGHIIQVGQQAYLVPQSMVGLRHPGTQTLNLSHVIGGAAGNVNMGQVPTAPTGSTLQAEPKNYSLNDASSFRRTQVDGGNDSEDDADKYYQSSTSSMPPSNQPAPPHRNTDSAFSMGQGHMSDTDDEDDDDLIPATPGLTPGSIHHSRRDHPTDFSSKIGSTLFTTPRTPMTPGSPRNRKSQWSGSSPYGKARDTPNLRHGLVSLTGSKRHGDHLMYDDDDDEAAEIMTTTTTMTPADRRIELDDDDDDEHHRQSATPTRPVQSRKSNKKPATQANNKTKSPDHSNVPEPIVPELSAGGPDDDEDDDYDDEEDEDPLNSEDDVSDEEPGVLFESDNVVVCQYEKIHRSRNRWRFHLRDGIMAIEGRDHVFQKAIGEAEW